MHAHVQVRVCKISEREREEEVIERVQVDTRLSHTEIELMHYVKAYTHPLLYTLLISYTFSLFHPTRPILLDLYTLPHWKYIHPLMGLPNSPLYLPVGIELWKKHHDKLKDTTVKKYGRDESNSLIRDLAKGAIDPVQSAYIPEAA